MLTYTDSEYVTNTSCVVALGCFDGVHKAHAKVISTAVEIARKASLPSLVWSFAEPPRKFYAPDTTLILTDAKEKERLIAELGADILVSINFDEKIASISAEDFFYEYILKSLGAVHVVCGYNFTFGLGGKGNTDLLSRLCHENSIGFTAVPSVEEAGVPVSSSKIRELLSLGNTEEAKALLGRYYSITTVIKAGKQLGRTLGFPTINQELTFTPPLAFGVYLSRITLEGDEYFGITNIGTRPTVNGKGVIAETNIFDFSGDIYGKSVTVEFLHFLRAEKKFISIDELACEVKNNIETAKKLIKNYK